MQHVKLLQVFEVVSKPQVHSDRDYRSCDHSMRPMWFPIGVPLTPTCYIELFARY